MINKISSGRRSYSDKKKDIGENESTFRYAQGEIGQEHSIIIQVHHEKKS